VENIVNFAHQIGLYFFNRFVLGWYGVEKRLTEIEGILEEIRGIQEHTCKDCPSRPWSGQERRKSGITG
jgi:hypothetical protein